MEINNEIINALDKSSAEPLIFQSTGGEKPSTNRRRLPRRTFICLGDRLNERKDTPMRWQSGATRRTLALTDTSSALSRRTLLAGLAATPALTAAAGPLAAETPAPKTVAEK